MVAHPKRERASAPETSAAHDIMTYIQRAKAKLPHGKLGRGVIELDREQLVLCISSLLEPGRGS